MSKVIDFNTVFYMNKNERKFVDTVMSYYQQHGRHTLPWRKTKNPYKILVSEVMLQQTQVDRVIPKYKAFLKQFPTVAALSRSSLGEVLRAWQGLGYNRRAKMLHECAKEVIKTYKGQFPRDEKVLRSLRGVGPYTASAVCAFAFNAPTVLIETNVRTVFLHHFYPHGENISDADILTKVANTADTNNPREWYYALMDYGSYLKKTVGNKNIQSATYAKQSRFEGSDRQIRGAIIRMLTTKPQARIQIQKTLSQFEDIRVDAQLQKLLDDQMVVKKGRRYQLPD